MIRRILIAVVAVVLLASMVIRLASNKSKIDKETSYRDSTGNVAVNVRTVQTSSRSHELALTGIFRPSKEAPLSAEIPGKIARVSAAEGDYLVAGQVIAELDQSTLLLKLAADQAQYDHSKEDLARYENLGKREATTDATLKQIRLTNTLNEIAVKNDEDQIGKSKIRAAISGYLTTKHFEVGMVVSPAATLGQIDNTDVLKFTAMVPEHDMVKLQLAQPVSLHADVYPDLSYPGTITQISARGDDNHQYKVEVTVVNGNKQHPLKAGMNGTLAVVVRGAVTGIFIPREALVGSTEHPQVYLAGNGLAVLKKVSAGGTFGTEIQILQGLSAGDRVVTTGMNSLKDSTTIHIVGDK